MKAGFQLDPNHRFECQWSLLTGHERYLLDGREIYRTRSFQNTGSRSLQVEIDGATRHIEIKLLFRPSWASFRYSGGYVAEVYVDGQLIIPNLMEKRYRQVPLAIRVLDNGLVIFFLVLLFIIIDGNFFEGTILGLNPDNVPRSVRTLNAALATPECRAQLTGIDSSVLLSERKARDLREREMRRDINWHIDDERTVISVITSVFESQGPACRRSILKLLDRYLANGADIDERYGFRDTTVLESAILSGEPALVCELLKRGASLQARVTAHNSDGTDSPITGLNLAELASYQESVAASGKSGRLLRIVEDFLSTRSCNSPAPNPY